MIRCPPELGVRTGGFVNVQEVEEGKEPTEFWNAIGPQDRKSYDCMLQGVHLLLPITYLLKHDFSSGSEHGSNMGKSNRWVLGYF